jgi:hypothetical protein
MIASVSRSFPSTSLSYAIPKIATRDTGHRHQFAARDIALRRVLFPNSSVVLGVLGGSVSSAKI